MSDFNEQHRYGRADWATMEQIYRAGLLAGRGPYLAHTPDGRHALTLPTDGHVAYIGGVGSGKSAGWYLINQCGQYLVEGDGQASNSVDLDLRGDLTAVSTIAATKDGIEQYSWNPAGVAWAPQLRTTGWDHLRLDSPAVIAYNRDAVSNLLPLSIDRGGRSKWWEQDAQEWATQINLSVIERYSKTSMPKLYRKINSIEGDLDAWIDHLEFMGKSRFMEVRRCAGTIMDKQKEGREGFTAPMSHLYASLNFLQDPRIQNALEEDDFSMGDVVDDTRRVRIKLIVPIEYLRQWAPAIRALIGSTIIQKLRKPEARRVTFQVDECGQLGAFPAIRQLYSFGRGAGCRALCAWQSTGQMMEAFGMEGYQEIMNSAQVRMFKGVRDIATAGVVSRMLGTQTLHYDDSLKQADARRQKRKALRRMIDGEDPFEIAHEIRHFKNAAEHRTKQARDLMTESEVLNLDRNKLIIFFSDLDVDPVQATSYLYFQRPELAGRYLDNPFHEKGRVKIQGRFSSTWAPVVTEAVPRKYAHLPQYASGQWRYVKGYRP